MDKLHVLGAGLAALVLSACAEQRVNQNQSKVGPNLYEAQYSQINYQLSKSIDDPYSIPIFAFVSTTALNSTDSATLGGTYTSAAAGLTRTFTGSFGGVSNSFLYTGSPVGDPDAQKIVRDIYAYTVGQTEWQAEFDKLTIPPPHKGWLVKDSSAQPGLFLIGKYGAYTLWTRSRKDYSDFILSVLSAFAPIKEDAAPAGGKGTTKGKKAPKTGGARSYLGPATVLTVPAAEK
ncbi:hypothetical protein FJ986_23450 [Mesorhizobium sp. B1-1-1]|uniref:hypothetical protein n=1 Tax=Mesorhizobium sp. B1-1-1 TaxID=2589983 RepID=UPI00112C19A2|nr:hypothetical protein [Mesorhizobium sp. B1-1-1]TPN63607.1 hypothetical protein FJ986_23450 [Mesorhizobium sp. B1-1-1]